MNPFNFIDSINLSKKDLLAEDPLNIKDYSPFIVNRGLSYFHDTVMYANQMNIHNDIPKDWQYSFLLNSIPKKKRFSKWHKKETEPKSLQLVMEYFNYSSEKAKEALKVLSPEQLKVIETKLDKGGTQK